MGVGAFGMSTVPEVLSANNLGMAVFGVSLVSNFAAGLLDEKLTHADVTRVANEAGPRFEKFLLALVRLSPFSSALIVLHRLQNAMYLKSLEIANHRTPICA